MSDQLVVHRYGEDAVLIESTAPLELAAALARALDRPAVEVVPAAATVLVRLDRDIADPVRLIRTLLAGLGRPLPRHNAEPGLDPVIIPVRYDGPDLADVAAHTRRSITEVIARHSGVEYTVAFCGFAPGFAYLTGLDPVLRVPRLTEPRLAVPAGAVAIAGEFAAVYPRSSPGGWRLLGQTDVRLWDVARRPPALLVPGTRVRFVPA